MEFRAGEISKLIQSIGLIGLWKSLDSLMTHGHISNRLSASVLKVLHYHFLFILTSCADFILGMFLFAKLVLQNLYSQVSRKDLYRELQADTLPKGFAQV